MQKRKELSVTKQGKVKTFLFQARLQEEDDGRWSAWVEDLPGCAAWGSSREEALEGLKDSAELFVEDMLETGEEIPDTVQVVQGPVVAVTA